MGGGPTGIVFGAGSVWVTNSLDGTVSRIDPGTNSVVATIPTGNGPAALDADDSGVWVSNQFDGTVVRIDPTTNRSYGGSRSATARKASRSPAATCWSVSVAPTLPTGAAPSPSGTISVPTRSTPRSRTARRPGRTCE